MSKKLQEQIPLMCELRKQGFLLKDIAEKIGCDPRTVSQYLKKSGIEIRPKKEIKKDKNIDYFETIDTPSKAYLLGFYFTDGNLYYAKSNNSYRVSLAVNSRDIEVLEFAKHEMDVKREIYGLQLQQTPQHKKVPMSYLVFSCKKMFHDLGKYGVVPNKTYKTNKLAFDMIPEELHSHYIRGLIDGDGCITKSVNSQGGIYWSISFTNNSFEIVEELTKYIFTNVIKRPITISVRNRQKQHRGCEVCFAKQEDLATLFPYLYLNTNEFALSRKRALAEEGYNYVMKRLKERGIIE